MNTEQDTSSRKRRDGGNVCAYKDCKNRSYSSTNIIFHSFPKDPEKYFYRNILYNYVIKLNVIHRSVMKFIKFLGHPVYCVNIILE